MINIRIIKEGKEIEGPEQFLSNRIKQGIISFYDPLGLHSVESPYYVIAVLRYMKKYNEIDNYEILTPSEEFPKFEFKPGVIY